METPDQHQNRKESWLHYVMLPKADSRSFTHRHDKNGIEGLELQQRGLVQSTSHGPTSKNDEEARNCQGIWSKP
jgi:hypothetical protein